MPLDPYSFDPNSSIVYLALSLLCGRQGSLIPELLYVLNPQQVTTFIKVFSGETIRVPTVEDFNKDILTAIAIHHIVIEGKSWDWFQLKYSLDSRTMRSVKNRLEAWAKGLSLDEQKFIEKLRDVEIARQESEEWISVLSRKPENVRK